MLYIKIKYSTSSGQTNLTSLSAVLNRAQVTSLQILMACVFTDTLTGIRAQSLMRAQNNLAETGRFVINYVQPLPHT